MREPRLLSRNCLCAGDGGPTLGAGQLRSREWIHEIKHDGYPIIARKDGDKVRLWSRNGRDWSRHFVAVADAVRAALNKAFRNETCTVHSRVGTQANRSATP
jgi:hypothetical protein